MGFGQSVKTCFGKYADFKGRALRSEFWWFYLFLQLVFLPFWVIFMVLYVAAFATSIDAYGNFEPTWANFAPMIIVYAVMSLVNLVLLIPFLAASARRLHDMGQSGHWLWLNVAGLGVVPLIMCIMDTQPFNNQWGPDPKAHERVAMGGYNAGYHPSFPPPPPA
ncbi:MAG: DUF805 domain-containing protein [Actinobacteria bacterium HGW-Actinobacteria-4]|nr:MAG: DUF805 domain-containing protein [Actinobacteria bacterium HGW-Actinobacteria-4]